jgi:preprotein translocase subunit SecG
MKEDKKMYITLLILHILICLLLIFAVLIQSGKGSSMANIFGGGGMENVFGAETPAILNKITAFLAIMFIITSVLLAIIPGKLTTRSILKEELNKPKKVLPSAPPSSPVK